MSTMWGRGRIRQHLADAGFENVTVQRLDHDPQNDYWVIRRSS